MPVSEAQKKASVKYLEKLDEVRIRMPKGRKDIIKAHAESQGESVNGFINRAIDHQISKDCDKGPSETLQGPSGGVVVSLPSEGKFGERIVLEVDHYKKEEWEDSADILNVTLDKLILDAIENGIDQAIERNVGDDIVVLSQNVIEAAQEAAQCAGETPEDFIVRAVTTQAKRDKAARKRRSANDSH